MVLVPWAKSLASHCLAGREKSWVRVTTFGTRSSSGSGSRSLWRECCYCHSGTGCPLPQNDLSLNFDDLALALGKPAAMGVASSASQRHSLGKIHSNLLNC